MKTSLVCALFLLSTILLSVAPQSLAQETSTESSTTPHKDDHIFKLSDEELKFWVTNMRWHHKFGLHQISTAFETSNCKMAGKMKRLGILRREQLPEDFNTTGFRVMPYPGFRHPRIGFLDGAINPHRDTKVSVFLPWEDSGYVVVDFPEAVWAVVDGKRELMYLAHTHIPTYWDKQKITLERFEWQRKEKGVLEGEKKLPNGLSFETRVLPRKDYVDLEMTLTNGTDQLLTGLRNQICCMLKGAPDFNSQTKENKLYQAPIAAVHNKAGDKWIVTVWENGDPRGNVDCPCFHADPIFPDLNPGKSATLHGRVFFYAGEDLKAEIERRTKAGTLNWKGD